MDGIEWVESPTNADFEALAGLVSGFWAEVIPGERPTPAAEVAGELLHTPAHERRCLVLATDGAGDVVGAATLLLADIEGRDHLGWIEYLVVEPASRRRGIGTRLVDAAIERSRAAGRRVVMSAADATSAAVEAMAGSLGATAGLAEQQNRLDIARLDRELLEGWLSRAPERASGYSLVSFDNGCPDDLLEPYTRMIHVMNDAPHSPTVGEFRMRSTQVRATWDMATARGETVWTACARDDRDGSLVGYTELVLPSHRPWFAWQGDTGVDPVHRNHGLGRWLKAHNALRLLDERPEVDTVDTWNAGTNAAMLAINQAMGFRTIAEWIEWELPI